MEHTHEHTHEHSHHTPADLQETKAMLTFMISHNDHHNDELAGLLDSLPTKSAKLLMRAIGSFEAANVELQEVLRSLD